MPKTSYYNVSFNIMRIDVVDLADEMSYADLWSLHSALYCQNGNHVDPSDY